MEKYDKQIAIVKETNDYSKFKKMNGNRDLITNKKLEEDIIDRGQIQPIIVDIDYNIYDGQHRFEVLKNNEMPVKYIVDDHLKKEFIISINNTSKKWTDEDFLNFFSTNGKVEYVKLKNFYDTHNLTLPVVIAGGMGAKTGSGTRISTKFRNPNGSAYFFLTRNNSGSLISLFLNSLGKQV